MKGVFRLLSEYFVCIYLCLYVVSIRVYMYIHVCSVCMPRKFPTENEDRDFSIPKTGLKDLFMHMFFFVYMYVCDIYIYIYIYIYIRNLGNKMTEDRIIQVSVTTRILHIHAYTYMHA
jgi:hypothetical protein